MYDGTPKKFVDLKCGECHKPFQKEKKEYDRQVRNGKCNFFCGFKCAGVVKESKPNAPYRLMWRHAKRSSKTRNHTFNLSVEYLEKLWEKQGGKCAYTGIKLTLPTYKHISSPRKASLDRIDSSKGYEEGNVEFVCVFVNLGKNGYSKQEITGILNEFKMGSKL